MGAAGVWLTDRVMSPHVGVGDLGWTMGLAGVGFGIVAVAVTAGGLRALPVSESGVAASMVNTARELGAVTGVAVLGSIVNGQLTVALMQRLIKIGVHPHGDQMCGRLGLRIGHVHVPAHCPGVPDEVLNPRNTWADPEAYDEAARDLRDG